MNLQLGMYLNLKMIHMFQQQVQMKLLLNLGYFLFIEVLLNTNFL